MKTYGGVDVQAHILLTLALVGGYSKRKNVSSHTILQELENSETVVPNNFLFFSF
jgi:hypothetical protein